MKNLDKKNKSVIIISAIIAVVYAIVFLVIPFIKLPASWISFVFTLISIGVSCYMTIYAFSKNENEPLVSKVYGFPVFRIGYIYLIAQFVVGLIICIIGAFTYVPYWVALVLSIILLALAGIGLMATDNTREYIEQIEEEEKRVTKAIKTFRLDITSIVDACSDAELKKEVEKLAEEFRFSDPVSNDATAEIEEKLQNELNALKVLIDNNALDQAKNKVTEVKRMLADRNRICKMNK